jgi:hypothetical protein
MALIYQEVEALLASKHAGRFAVERTGQGFIHKFTGHAAAMGVGGGAVLICKNGEAVPLPHNTILLIGDHNLFGYRVYKR